VCRNPAPARTSHRFGREPLNSGGELEQAQAGAENGSIATKTRAPGIGCTDQQREHQNSPARPAAAKISQALRRASPASGARAKRRQSRTPDKPARNQLPRRGVRDAHRNYRAMVRSSVDRARAATAANRPDESVEPPYYKDKDERVVERDWVGFSADEWTDCNSRSGRPTAMKETQS